MTHSLRYTAEVNGDHQHSFESLDNDRRLTYH